MQYGNGTHDLPKHITQGYGKKSVDGDRNKYR
jgi:hypothetical protein